MRIPCAVMLLACLVLASTSSCRSTSRGGGAPAEMFRPIAMRIHPVFTGPKDWTDDGRPDGIEALIELTDQFGDPIKGSGQVIFELFRFRRYHPDPRGTPIQTWVMPIQTLKEQKEHWRRIGSAYAFQLPLDNVASYPSTVLTAEITLDNGGGRIRDQIVLQQK